jgi:hypothetical protein
MRSEILDEIRRIASVNGGPPGARLFEKETGIRQSAWRGVFWARWGDAVAEAGLKPNAALEKYDEDFLLSKLAEVCRKFGKAPTAMEFRMFGRANPEFPNHKSIYRHFQSSENMFRRLAAWTNARVEYKDVAAILATKITNAKEVSKSHKEGSVYLIQWGTNFKIGRSEQLERRVKEVRTGLPDKGELIHVIRTDDPPGIEAYWHRRFADRRASNGEWFRLTRSDIAAFKRRKFQ